MSDRQVDLETRLTFLEDTVDQLSTRLYEADRQMQALEQNQLELARRMVNLSADQGSNDDEPPPHY